MRRAVLIAWALVGLAAVVVGTAAVLVLSGYGTPGDEPLDLLGAVAVLAFVTVGALVVSRVPGNRVGWVFLAAGLSLSVGVFLDLYTNLALAEGLPGAVPVSVAIQALWVPVFMLIFPLPVLFFPDGRLPSPWWRWVIWSGLAACVVAVPLGLLAGGPLSPLPEVQNPLGVESLDPDDTLLGAIWVATVFALVATTFVGAASSMVARFRRSRGVERQQLKWFAYAAALAGVGYATTVSITLVTEFAAGDRTSGVLLHLPYVLGVLAVPVAAGLAILRYRLYDIDLVINKTVVFALLAGFIVATYSLVVVGVGRLVGGAEGLALPIAATAVVAVAFEPVRHRAQRWANRMVYGKRSTPYEVLADLIYRLAEGESGEGILARMAALLRDGTGADRVTVWLGSLDDMEPGVTSPADAAPLAHVDLDADHVFAVRHDDELVGALEVVKPAGSVLSSTERSLVSDLAGSAGLVVGYQRLNDSLAERAREVERSRLRLVEAQDQERRRLERALHDGVQQLIVSLKLKIDLASRLATAHGATDLEDLLRTLGKETETALAEVRSLAKGIYPPVLLSDGLGAAVSALAAGAPVEVIVKEDGIGRYSPDVEAAVYFDVSEAVTNAVKHARPPIQIELSGDGEALRFSVSDAGPGFNVPEADGGSGLVNMEDRLDAVGGRVFVSSSPGQGTTVSGEIPLTPALV